MILVKYYLKLFYAFYNHFFEKNKDEDQSNTGAFAFASFAFVFHLYAIDALLSEIFNYEMFSIITKYGRGGAIVVFLPIYGFVRLLIKLNKNYITSYFNELDNLNKIEKDKMIPKAWWSLLFSFSLQFIIITIFKLIRD